MRIIIFPTVPIVSMHGGHTYQIHVSMEFAKLLLVLLISIPSDMSVERLQLKYMSATVVLPWYEKVSRDL